MNNLKLTISLIVLLFPIILISQVSVSPKISGNLNHYYWNNKNIVEIEKPQSWTWGIGALARMRISRKVFGQFAFNIYPFGIEFSDEIMNSNPIDVTATTSTDLFDIKLGLDYQLYPNTLVGIGIEMEQYYNSQKILNTGSRFDEFYLNQKYFGAEVSLSHTIGKVELSADIFIGLHEGSSFLDPYLTFFSHKKLQLGLAIPIDLSK